MADEIGLESTELDVVDGIPTELLGVSPISHVECSGYYETFFLVSNERFVSIADSGNAESMDTYKS